jgi:1,4-dihydroxy-2-naphthoyl-CoA synthase
MGTGNFAKITGYQNVKICYDLTDDGMVDNRFCWLATRLALHDRRGKEGRNAFLEKENQF